MRTHKKETFLLFCRGIQSDKTLVAVRLRLKLLHTRHATSPGLLQQRPAFRMDPTQQRPAPLAAQPPPLEPPHAEPHTFLLWVRACGATRKRNRNFKRRKIENKVSQAALRYWSCAPRIEPRTSFPAQQTPKWAIEVPLLRTPLVHHCPSCASI